jgi:hypothetical protein
MKKDAPGRLSASSRSRLAGEGTLVNSKIAVGGAPTSNSSINQPLFILALPRSFTSVICAMLGQHPEMYGLPEMHFFSAETIGDWLKRCERARAPIAHGPLRAAAELIYGAQTEQTITLAQGWLRRRSHYTTGLLLESLAEKVAPQILVDKSPSMVRRPEFLRRAYRMFPQARFIHLLRHPVSQGKSVMKFIQTASRTGPVPEWLLRLGGNASRSGLFKPLELDPQQSWYERNLNVCEFLTSVPDSQKMQLRGEDVLTEPDLHLRHVATWLGIRTDAEAIEQMKHPERSPYACFGPKNARAGNDPSFLSNPVLRPAQVKQESLEGPLSWRPDGFLPKVKHLAREFGYQ